MTSHLKSVAPPCRAAQIFLWFRGTMGVSLFLSELHCHSLLHLNPFKAFQADSALWHWRNPIIWPEQFNRVVQTWFRGGGWILSKGWGWSRTPTSFSHLDKEPVAGGEGGRQKECKPVWSLFKRMPCHWKTIDLQCRESCNRLPSYSSSQGNSQRRFSKRSSRELASALFHFPSILRISLGLRFSVHSHCIREPVRVL